MRISRTSTQFKAGSAKASKAKGGESFSPNAAKAGSATDDAAPAAATAATGGVASLGAVDAVMALQSVDSVGERRARALRKGRRLLDALDRLTLSMLDDNTSTAHMSMLKRAIGEQRDESGDAGLDSALSHIEVRAAVEIAKLERRRQASKI